MLSASPSAEISDHDLKNKAFSVLGVVNANKKMLVAEPGKPLKSSWLELGSVVFKTLVFNPTGTVQEMSVDYLLPEEVKNEKDITEIDPSLTFKFDESKKQFRVTGKLTLDPSESKIVLVRVNDVWVVDQKEILSLKEQTAKVSQSLSKLSFVPYFAEGLQLEKEIYQSLDRAMELSKSLQESPEMKISSYHKANHEIEIAKDKLEELQEKSKLIPF